LAFEKTPDGKVKAVEQYRQILFIAPGHRWAQLQLERLNQQAKAD
jgi:hypothetical protein